MVYKKAVEMLGENLASLLELAKKWFVGGGIQIITTSEFFKNGHNDISKTDFSDNFKNIFQSILDEKFEKLTEKPEEIIVSGVLAEYQLMNKDTDGYISPPTELAQKFNYFMSIEQNPPDYRGYYRGKDSAKYFGYFRDKNNALHYVYIFWSATFLCWYGKCRSVYNSGMHTDFSLLRH